ncbi:MAG: hypothetical protein MUE52_00990 [Tabrizicola sp.]|jgi:hypothetical protein|nr:hypothetical protein [Tabrizicola sp.]
MLKKPRDQFNLVLRARLFDDGEVELWSLRENDNGTFGALGMTFTSESELSSGPKEALTRIACSIAEVFIGEISNVHHDGISMPEHPTEADAIANFWADGSSMKSGA